MGREITGHTISQNSLIYEYLKKHGSINNVKAVEEFGCYRLSARIDDLRRKGIEIKTQRCTKKNSFGHTVNYANYILVQE